MADLRSSPSAGTETEPVADSAVALTAASGSVAAPRGFKFRRNELWTYFGPAFVASVAYIDPGNFATNIEGGSRFGYRLLWVLLWSNAMAILIQYLSAKLGIVTGLTLPQNCRKHFSRPMTIFLWAAAEVSAIATDLAEFLGAALGLYLLVGPAMLAHGWTRTETMFAAALISAVAVFLILALDLAGYQWLEWGIMAFVGVIGLCYGFEVFLVHPDWKLAAYRTLLPTLDPKQLHTSLYVAVGMLGATVMPHVIYLHSALVQPRVAELKKKPMLPGSSRRRKYLRFELIDVLVAMNGAWLINSAMILMAAVAFSHLANPVTTIEQAHETLGPLLGPVSATVFAVALLCSGLSSSTVGVMAGQVIIEGFLDIKFSIFLRRLITIIPALLVIGVGLDPLKILILSQVVLSFTLPFALIPLLILTNRQTVMKTFVSARRTKIAGWVAVGIILTLNVVLLEQIAFGG
ncbi:MULTISPECIES: Nramp family divalent metal transporter [Acidobacteriaceae]|uniref:Nramp family divalent metal transporter n=1 Tax=Acidobacteriaceae TaxID=204434 RepID=UPI00131DCC47|nr:MULTISPECIES: Nramp family divalent metal transporter [Acidobacteriaceae]MDW5265763.1 Nramp family divalent metal transporter [Edaphobacter sp.]